MPYKMCDQCETRYYWRDGQQYEHKCGAATARKRRTQVPCTWPDCKDSVDVIPHSPNKRIPYVQYRIDSFHGAGLVRYPICIQHRKRMLEIFGTRVKWNGIKAIARGLDEPFSGRRLSAPTIKLVLYERAQGCCQHCKKPLQFFATDWEIDHVTPVFKGGKTTLRNLQLLCIPCHMVKSAPEKREACNNRQRKSGTRRWHTVFDKDQIIARLESEVARLNTLLASYVSEEELAG